MTITYFVMKVNDIVVQLSTFGYKVLEENKVHPLLNGVYENYNLVHATISSAKSI